MGFEYDCELSDTWSVGVIAFMLHAKMQPFGNPPSCPGIGTWDDLLHGQDNANFWKRYREHSERHLTPRPMHHRFKEFINTLWRINASERPRFSQLKLAIDGDSDTIEQFPGLAWLADPVNNAFDFVQELVILKPDIVLNCSCACEVLALYVRDFHISSKKHYKAFMSADIGATGLLTTSEQLERALRALGIAYDPDQFEDIMDTYAPIGVGMTAPVFGHLVKAESRKRA